MKHRWPLFLVFIFSFWSFSVSAQNAPSPAALVYKVDDVAVDVTAESAAKARDQAIADAQKSAFSQLLSRLGVDPSLGAKLSANDMATLVKNFEVSNEKTSAVRYIGNFTVQFRPTAVQNYLSSRHAKFNDTPGQPVLVIPVVQSGYRTILWEEPTKWYKAWVGASRSGGMSPIIIPSGTNEDKLVINGADAIAGKVESIKDLVESYHTSGAVVAVINGMLDNPTSGYTIDVQHFGTGFDAGSEIEHITLAGSTDKNAVDGILSQGINQVRQMIDKEQKDFQKNGASAAEDTPSPENTPVTVWNDEIPSESLPVTVQFRTLAEWADIQRRLVASEGVVHVNVSSVGRGVTEIELKFTGTLENIQLAVAQHGLRLTQDVLSGHWMLKGS